MKAVFKKTDKSTYEAQGEFMRDATMLRIYKHLNEWLVVEFKNNALRGDEFSRESSLKNAKETVKFHFEY